jgi:hypothetical protein
VNAGENPGAHVHPQRSLHVYRHGEASVESTLGAVIYEVPVQHLLQACYDCVGPAW